MEMLGWGVWELEWVWGLRCWGTHGLFLTFLPENLGYQGVWETLWMGKAAAFPGPSSCGG